MTETITPNWIEIQVEYRAGIKPLRLIAQEHGITHGAINKRAKKEEWVRDLGAKIKAKASDKVSKAAVSKEVSIKTLATESQVVEANAELQYQVRMRHRKGLVALTDAKDKLLAHVQEVIEALPVLSDIVEMLRNSDENGRDHANDRMRKSMERSTVIDDLKKLAEVEERVRKGELQAFGIEDGSGDGNPEGRQKRVILEFVDVVAK